MLLLVYRRLTSSDHKPTAPLQIFTNGVLEETITDWYWNEDPLFTYGWIPTQRIYNFEHANMKASIQRSHTEQQECLTRRGYRYPHNA